MAEPCDQAPPPCPDRFDEARRALDRKWALIALTGKKPVHNGWQKRHPDNLTTVLQWVREGHNLGLRTGKVSGVIVIDDDSTDGGASAALNLPKTIMVITGSGKRHLYFKVPPFKVGNSVRTLAPGIDVRGDGGQVVYPGSIHPDTGQPYRWAPGLSPEEVGLASLPDHFLDKLRPRPRLIASSTSTTARLAAYVDAALDSALAKVRSATEGSRNDILNKESFAMGQLVGAGALDRGRAVAALADAAIAAGLSEGEARKTVQSGMEAGAASPRDLSSITGSRAGGRGKDHAPERQDSERDGRPTIKVQAGCLHTVVDSAEDVLGRVQPAPFYQRGTCLVRVVHVPSVGRAGGRPTKLVFIREIDATYLVEALTRLVHWERFDARSNEYRTCDCPDRVARTLLARADWVLPKLVGVISTPTLRFDGTILADQGYDPRSHLYLASSDCIFPPVPGSPSKEDAVAALSVLREPLKKFPFLEEADRSVAISAILTSLIRASLRTAPLFVFGAPKMGSGKSLLADIVALIATGRCAAVMAQGRDENEDKKRMLPILMEGDPVAVIDNIDRPFGSAALCSILTQTTYRDRVLGKSETLTLPTTNTTWLATGNNIQFDGDITTRVLLCYLDPKCERPEEREFDVNLHQYVPQNRGALVVAGLTILRAYHLADRPPQNLSVFGRFEEWSSWVRSAIVWLGLPDPCSTRSRVESTDPVRQQLGALLDQLQRCFQLEPFQVSQVLACGDPQLRQALLSAISTDGTGHLQNQRLGIFLQRHQLRIEGGLRLVRHGEHGGSATWKVERVQ